MQIASFFLKLIAVFNPKIKLFVSGRKNTFNQLKEKINKEDAVIWVHTASLGEFEQGLPIIEKLKIDYPLHKIVVSFFSPSGYEVKKNSPIADVIVYLPLDTKENAEKFITLLQPKLVVFVKYEIWPNYLKALEERKTPTLLIAALFKKEQVFFKWYGGFMRRSLNAFTHFFVQNEASVFLLKSINFPNVTIGGDTRFDRVSEILERDNSLDFMYQFKQKEICLVAGSTWPEDEAILVNYINSSSKPIKYVFAPHTIKASKIQALIDSITKKTLLYSEIKSQDISSYEVLIIDTIGVLTKIYSYADIAYVGGAFSTGLHNTLEPAVFGIPIIIGPHYKGFKEAEDLVDLKGITPILNKTDFTKTFGNFLNSSDLIKRTGEINTSYIESNKGASVLIMDFIHTVL